MITRRWRDRGRSPIALQVLIYPVTDAGMNWGSYGTFGDNGLPMSARDMEWFWDQYCPLATLRDSPVASPLHAEDLRGLPPAMFVIAEHDVLRDETLAYARRLGAAGVEVTVDRYEHMIHGFFPLVGVLDAAQTAVENVTAACSSALRGFPPRGGHEMSTNR